MSEAAVAPAAGPGIEPAIDHVRVAHRPDGTRLATRHRSGAGPALLFLPGWRSDMEGAKAQAIDDWTAATARAMLRFDYAGCGASDGRFEDQTLAGWRDDAVAMIDRVTGPVVLVGSSMGGWLMLLAALARPERIAGMVGIAAAPDFTDWGYDDDARATIARDGRFVAPSAYGDDDVTTRAFWDSGQALRLLGRPIATAAPLRLIHGQADDVVPSAIALRIAEQACSADVQTILVKDGDHRLSRPRDIALLIATIAQLPDAS